MWLWLKISICQSSMVHEGCWGNCPTRVGNFEASTVCWREATRQAQLSRYQAVLDRVYRVAVKNLVLNQEDKPKRHQSARYISHETVILCSSVYRKIIHRDLQLTLLQMTSCSAVVWSQSYIPSHSLINNVIVCNKSCYCSIINRKLYNK